MAQLTVLGPRDWADGVAQRLAERLRREPRLRLCLPTGDTPSPVYERLVALNREGLAPFGQATIVLLDEYVGLPPDDPARCDARLRRELLDLLEPGPVTFHAISVDELAPDAAAEAHDAVAAEGLDLALVGLGLNGHVGFNEPGSTADSPTRAVDLAGESRRAATARYGAGAEPTRGITLGMARLLNATDVWLLVSGAQKATILQRTLVGPISADCPASLLRGHPRLRVLTEEGATAKLS